jgi:hypothetical protein
MFILVLRDAMPQFMMHRHTDGQGLLGRQDKMKKDFGL